MASHHVIIDSLKQAISTIGFRPLSLFHLTGLA